MNRILVPTDFSKITENAYKMALSIAKKSDAEIYLVNVIEPIVDLGFSASGSANGDHLITEEDRYVYELHKVNERRLSTIASKFPLNGVTVFPVITIGKVGEAIAHYSNKIKADLIVMGTSGENTFEEYFAGNHTEQVMRETHCPVLAVRNEIDAFDINDVVIATDFTSNADEGMKHMEKIFKSINPTVHMVHIAKSANISIENTNKKIADFAQKYHLENFTTNVIKNSNMKIGIEKFAKEVNADMIVAFTHGRKGLAGILKGNISEKLVKETPLPVLSIHFD